MVEVFRRRVIRLLVDRELLNENFARNLLSWKHSGFSIDNSVRILDESAQESPAEYIARPPISLKKIRCEPFKERVLFHTTYSHYFKQNLHMFEALDFLADLTGAHPAQTTSAHSPLRPLRLEDKGPVARTAVTGSFLGFACGTTLS